MLSRLDLAESLTWAAVSRVFWEGPYEYATWFIPNRQLAGRRCAVGYDDPDRAYALAEEWIAVRPESLLNCKIPRSDHSRFARILIISVYDFAERGDASRVVRSTNGGDKIVGAILETLQSSRICCSPTITSLCTRLIAMPESLNVCWCVSTTISTAAVSGSIRWLLNLNDTLECGFHWSAADGRGDHTSTWLEVWEADWKAPACSVSAAYCICGVSGASKAVSASRSTKASTVPDSWDGAKLLADSGNRSGGTLVTAELDVSVLEAFECWIDFRAGRVGVKLGCGARSHLQSAAAPSSRGRMASPTLWVGRASRKSAIQCRITVRVDSCTTASSTATLRVRSSPSQQLPLPRASQLVSSVRLVFGSEEFAQLVRPSKVCQSSRRLTSALVSCSTEA